MCLLLKELSSVAMVLANVQQELCISSGPYPSYYCHVHYHVQMTLSSAQARRVLKNYSGAESNMQASITDKTARAYTESDLKSYAYLRPVIHSSAQIIMKNGATDKVYKEAKADYCAM